MRLLTQLLFNALLFVSTFSCLTAQADLHHILENWRGIEGQPKYLSSPFVTAADRLYIVGHQDGQFPDLGWHIPGEMGGIWLHPIKLADGYSLKLFNADQDTLAIEAQKFVNYPLGNTHFFKSSFEGLSVQRSQAIPDQSNAIIIEYTLLNQSNSPLELTADFTLKHDLRPTWLGERTAMLDTDDANALKEFDASKAQWVVQEKNQPWFVALSTDSDPTQVQQHASNYHISLRQNIKIEPSESITLRFFIAGSFKNRQEVQAEVDHIRQAWQVLMEQKSQRYQAITESSVVQTPDAELNQVYRWLKYNTDWLIRDVEGVGRGLGAGIPDYPWWFGVDNEYALQGVLLQGRKDIVYETIDLIHQLSERTNGNGRIIHEASTNGAVFNPGNINETPQFASLIWFVFRWTGDLDFLKKYFPTIQKGLEWIENEADIDGNGLPDGFGMMEIHGLDSEMIDVAVYTQQGFADAAKMAAALGMQEWADSYQQKADRLKEIINQEFWVEAFHSYADFIGSKEQALHIIEDAIIRVDSLDKPWAVKELKETQKWVNRLENGEKAAFVVHHNWVVNTPMEKGIAPKDQAIKALNTAQNFTNPFGMFVTGIDRDETAGTDEGSFAVYKKQFDYTGAVMTLPTGVQAIAEARYGRPDQALGYLQKMARSFSYALPGSMYEVSPDFGMITQAWTAYSFMIPLVEGFFGMHPIASEKTIYLKPNIPESWPHLRIDALEVGGHKISIEYAKERSQNKGIEVFGLPEDWTIILE